jgi:hypothetical protein
MSRYFLASAAIEGFRGITTTAIPSYSSSSTMPSILVVPTEPELPIRPTVMQESITVRR